MRTKRILPTLLALGIAGTLVAVRAAQTPANTPSENLARLTVRWEDPDKREVFVVEGARYQCRIGTWPARILSLRVDGQDLLGSAGLRFQVTDANGIVYRPTPRGITPAWRTWQGQNWRPARSGRARMNVWNSGLWYWDAHLLDIPLMSDSALRELQHPAGKVVREWTFETKDAGWEGVHNCTLEVSPEKTLRLRPTGDDPYVQSPPVDISGPVAVELRVRTRTAGGGAFYWDSDQSAGYTAGQAATVDISADGEWHTVTTRLPVVGRLERLRFDPPGTGDGQDTELALVRLREVPPAQGTHGMPLRGELIFHAFRDELRIEFRCDPPKGAAPPTSLTCQAPDAEFAGAEALGGRTVAMLGYEPAAAAVLAPPSGMFDPDLGEARAPLTGGRPGTWWVVHPIEPNRAAAAVFRNDIDPLPPMAVQVLNGHWLGWDPAAGLYRISSIMDPRAYGFSPAFDVPNRRMEVAVTIHSKQPRKLMIQGRSNSGILPATVLTDPNGFMLPTPVQSCKNFAGEREEPDDSAYGDAYFPMTVQPDHELRFHIVHLFQRWGDHLLKQVTSIRFFHIYWHLSTGVSETTCFTIPHFPLHGVYVRIPDYRPYSGPFWVGQPQHSCRSWPGLLQYRSGGKSVRLMYDETRFASVCPNLARFTMFFHTSDNAATATAEVMEVPQNDELRTFLHLRYEWQRPARIDGDARRQFRWLNINDKATPELVLWTDADGKFQTRPVRTDGKPMFEGVPLAPLFPVAGSHGIPGGKHEQYSSFVLVRGMRARLGGQTMNEPYLSAQYDKHYGNYWLCAPGEKLDIQPGDFIEADLMLMPGGDPTEPLLKPARERIRFGSEGPGIETVEIGRKVADFPATVAAENDVARCTLTGGHNALPLIVTGLSAPQTPLLWENALWMNPQCHGGDGVQVDPDGEGRFRWTFVIPLRHGMKPELTVTRADCSTGIARVRDLNGFPQLESTRVGRFRLAALMLFAPGVNTVVAEAPVFRFEGTATAVRAVPILVQPTGKTGTVQVDIRQWSETGADLSVSGPATVTFLQLADNRPYAVTVGDQAQRKTAVGRRIAVEAATAAVIHLQYLP